MRIARVATPEETVTAGALIGEYGRRYDFDFDDPEWLEEIAEPRSRYGAPDGLILLASLEEPAGVVALMRLDDRSCVMKRMYVRPRFRGRGIGTCLALNLLFHAERLGYERMVLDTPQSNEPALRLYRSVGFRPTAPFREPGHDHDHPDWAYLEIALPPPDEVWFENIKTLLERRDAAGKPVSRAAWIGR